MSQNYITIKGTRNGLMILLDASKDFNELKNNLIDKFSAAQGFFKGAPFTLVPTTPLSKHETDELEAICREYGLVPGTGISLKHSRRNKQNNYFENVSQVKPEKTPELPTLLKEGNLRNGQEIVYNGHVMFLGDVHQGSSIKATGNIMVMGTLRGSARAGIKGDTGAVIIAFRLVPEQIGIAGIIARSPEQNVKRPYPEIARLINNRIVVKPYPRYYNN